jgi:hypothetical protein
MSTSVRGTFNGQDRSDTYALWRKPGQYRFKMDVRGEGAVSLLLEAFFPGGETQSPAGGWLALADLPSARSGSTIAGQVTVPEVQIDPASKLEWVRLRLRISRIEPSQSVEYEFYLDPGEQGSVPAPQRTG